MDRSGFKGVCDLVEFSGVAVLVEINLAPDFHIMHHLINKRLSISPSIRTTVDTAVAQYCT
eukprot:1377934-Amorphochlora_amoeboformis.AAC.2